MTKNRKKNRRGNTGGPILLVLAGLAVLIPLVLRGTNVALFNSKGSIAHEQHSLMLLTVAVMLIIGIPAVFLIYFIAWKYRESNTKATRNPDAGHSKLLNVSIWLVPATIALVLALIMWPATHRLAPQKQLAADAKPLTIQVVALRWKWLFIYPEQHIATVNYVQIPTDTPVTFELTADEAPMSSFWIPNLGGMLYAMTGHTNTLNLMATTPGDYPGSSAEINGAGFAGMKFIASATTQEQFDQWVQSTRLTSKVLNDTEYNRLLAPSENNEPAFYSLNSSDLYDTVVMKYVAGHMEGMQH